MLLNRGPYSCDEERALRFDGNLHAPIRIFGDFRERCVRFENLPNRQQRVNNIGGRVGITIVS